MLILTTIALMATSQAGPTPPITADQVTQSLIGLKGKPRADRADMVAAVVDAAKRHKVDALWLLAVAYVESRHNRTLRGDKGRSRGPFQMGMGAARTVRPKVKAAELHRWPTAADIAARYWARLFKRYGVKVAPVIYNCGPVRCRQSDGTQRKETPATRAYWRAYRAMKGRIER